MTEHTHDPISEPLNRWLDGYVQGQTGSPGNGDLEPVARAAASFHALARAGERYAAGQRSPMATRWEDVMTGAAIPVQAVPASRQAFRPRAKRHRGVLRFVPTPGDTGTMAAILAVMLLVGSIFANLAPRGDDQGDNLAFVAGDATATPATDDAWLTPVGPDECTTDPRPEDDVATFFREPPALPERAYLPVGPVDPLVANGIAKTARMWIACDDPEHTAQQQAVESPWFIVDQDATRVTDPGNFATFAEWQAFTESLQEAFITAEPSSYVVISDQVPSTDEQVGSGMSGLALTAQPQHAVSLPDGRIAMVTTTLLEDGFTPDNSLDGATFEAPVLIFVQDETQSGRWVVDELLTLCVVGCDEEYLEAKAAWWTSVATPVGSTPMASPSPACMATSWFIGTNPAPFVDDPALAEVPWMEAETVSGDVTVLGLQLYGAHPLPVGGVFPGNGTSADMVWVTSEYVSQLRVTARSIDEPNASLVHIGTVPEGSRVNDTGMQWSSVMDLPSPGCWEITITASPVDGGEPVVAWLTMLVVANPNGVMPPSTNEATPAG